MSDPRPNPIVGAEGMAGPPQVGAQISAVEKKSDEAIASVRREIDSSWTAHQRQHDQEQDAVDKAVVTMDKRLDGLNELRQAMSDRDKSFATLDSLTETNKRLDRFETDTRARFEGMERMLRSESRPGQDMSLKSGAVIAAILFAVTIVGVVIAVVSFLGAAP